MKNIIRILIAFVGIFTISCTDDVENRENVSTNVAPTLNSPANGFTMVLNHDNPNDIATTFVWDYAAYNGTATVVNYSIEFDAAVTSGDHFTSPTVVATTTSKFQNFTVGELNAAALDAGLPPFVQSSIDVRIKSTIGTTGSLPQTSNYFTIKLTPYPAWPNWGIIGSATSTGWDSDTNLDYSLATRLYSITTHLNAGGAFKFRLDDGWGVNYGDDGNNLSLDSGGADIPVSVTGEYKIVVNFGDTDSGGVQAKHYTITLQ